MSGAARSYKVLVSASGRAVKSYLIVEKACRFVKSYQNPVRLFPVLSPGWQGTEQCLLLQEANS